MTERKYSRDTIQNAVSYGCDALLTGSTINAAFDSETLTDVFFNLVMTRLDHPEANVKDAVKMNWDSEDVPAILAGVRIN